MTGLSVCTTELCSVRRPKRSFGVHLMPQRKDKSATPFTYLPKLNDWTLHNQWRL
jgi:hypothetical protein